MHHVFHFPQTSTKLQFAIPYPQSPPYNYSFIINCNNCPNMEFQDSLKESPAATAIHMLVFATILFIVLKWLKKHLGGGKRSPPEPQGSWPIIGHLPLLVGSQPAHSTLAKLADQYGPIFKLKLGGHQAVVVSSWEIARECLTTHDKVFSNRTRARAFELLGYKYAMFGFAPYGPYWRQVRKIVTLELLSNNRLEMLKNVKTSQLTASMREIYDQCAQGTKMITSSNTVLIDMTQWLGDLTLNSILQLVVGKSIRDISSAEERDRYHKAIHDFLKLSGTFMISDALPFLKWLDLAGYSKIMKRVAEDLDNFLQRWLEEHKRSRISGEVKHERDLIDVMLEIFDTVDANSFGYDTDTIIKATSLGLIIAGADSVWVTMTWTLSLLLNNPHTLKKAREELDTHVGKDRNVNESDIHHLVYLQAVIKETLRLYPAAPLLPREAICDATVNGYDIPSGTRLILNLYKIHRDPSVWSDACEFRPERFLTTHKDVDLRGKNFELIPFGSGRRICPGISYALQTLPITLASVLHSFEIESPVNEPIDITEEPGMTCVKATPLQLFLTPRLPYNLYN